MSKLLVAAFSFVYATCHFFLVPGKFAFTYVNVMLGLHYALSAIFFLPKGEHYAITSALLTVPLGAVAWMEALMCEGGLRQVSLTSSEQAVKLSDYELLTPSESKFQPEASAWAPSHKPPYQID